MERAIADYAGRESGDGSAGGHSNASGNLAGAAVSHRGSAQDSEILSGAQGLRLSVSGESRQYSKGNKKSPDESGTKRDGSIIDNSCLSRARADSFAATTNFGLQDAR
jgi:hypothetical protein